MEGCNNYLKVFYDAVRELGYKIELTEALGKFYLDNDYYTLKFKCDNAAVVGRYCKACAGLVNDYDVLSLKHLQTRLNKIEHVTEDKYVKLPINLIGDYLKG